MARAASKWPARRAALAHPGRRLRQLGEQAPELASRGVRISDDALVRMVLVITKTPGATWRDGPLGGGSAVGVVVSNRGKRHFVSRIAFNHYSLLATIEKNWNLGYLAYASDRLRVPTMERFLTP